MCANGVSACMQKVSACVYAGVQIYTNTKATYRSLYGNGGCSTGAGVMQLLDHDGFGTRLCVLDILRTLWKKVKCGK